MNNLDHNEHKVVRTRLYSRILQVQGPANLQRLFTSLQIRMQMKFDNTFERCARGDGPLLYDFKMSGFHHANTNMKATLHSHLPTQFRRSRQSL